MRNHVHGDHTTLQLKFENHIMAIIVLLVAHYCATTKLWPHGCHYLLHIYVPPWGHSVGIVLQLDGYYDTTTWPLIKYYRFIIHINYESVNLKLDPNATKIIFKILILEVYQGIFLRYMNKCTIDNS